MKKFAVVALTCVLGATLVAVAKENEKEKKHEHRNHSKEDGKSAPATLPPVSPQTGVTYATDIKPILDSSCTDCHGDKKAKGHLRLDTLKGVLKGGEEGKIVIVGNSAKSLLVRSVAHATKDRDEWMPPPHNKEGIKALLPEEISLIRAWIDQGAK
jgi:hypothetical protein